VSARNVIPFATEAERGRNAVYVAEHLHAGGVIAYPTETVYGFGSTLWPEALADLAALKSREAARPFLLLVRSAEDLARVRWTEAGRRLARAFWPGALTLALPAEEGAYPPGVLSAEGTVAARVSPHPAPTAILGAVREPITSTSANLPGERPALDADEVLDVVYALAAFDSVLVLDGGRLQPSPPSTIVDCSREPPRVLRLGAIPLEALRAVVGEIDERS
jgi:L-threonylcarbamoyladenylate synthase